ncbi:hypothetical protein [Pseudomonas sp. UBA1879]|uniref:hypothetical protein n=1 Tax=Pseudomonas sp. UBA1879 TaxID=1947305 RepID=UPI0025EB9C00|nr:hypothetical protein [Pseudomonas sp. UBA1879]
MSQFTGKVVSIGEGEDKEQFGWIEYTPKEDDPENDDEDQIYFMETDVVGAFPSAKAEVTFIREDFPDKPGRYIARKVTIKK